MDARPSFPGYRLESLIGSGGAGHVFRGVALETGEAVAIKVFHAHRVNRPEFARRFEREVALSRTLDHPGVVRLLDLAVSDDAQSVALIMELVSGETLRPLLKQGAVEPRTALLIALQMVEILAYVHRKGVAHLDLKPENVLLVGGTTVRLMDFGISQATFGKAAREGGRTAMIAGTPHYMAPEQFAGAPDLDHRADVYAVGVILLAGERPAAGILALGDRLPPKFLREVEPVLAKLLAMTAPERYQTAVDVADKLKALLRSLEAERAAREAAARIVIAPPQPPPPAAKPSRPPRRPAPEEPGAAKDALHRIAEVLREHPWILFVAAFGVLLLGMYFLVGWAFSS